MGIKGHMKHKHPPLSQALAITPSIGEVEEEDEKDKVIERLMDLAYNWMGRSKVRLQPLSDRVIVKRIEGKEVTRGGIIVPDASKEKQQEGLIVAVGPGRREKGVIVPMDVKVGDTIIFGKYSGVEIVVDEEELLILREEELISKLLPPKVAVAG